MGAPPGRGPPGKQGCPVFPSSLPSGGSEPGLQQTVGRLRLAKPLPGASPQTPAWQDRAHTGPRGRLHSLLSPSQEASWRPRFLSSTPDTHRGYCEGPTWAAMGAKDSFAPHPVASLPQLGPAAGHRFPPLPRPAGDQFPRPCFQLKSTPTKRAPSLQVSIPNGRQAGQDVS